ncbi:aldehyde dehydrogenase family protein [Dactylosporangium cerinum]
MVVAADADLDRAVRDATTAALSGSGQACVSLQRVYVERPVASAFQAALARSFAATPCGDPRDERTVVGPLISRDAAERLAAWVAAAQRAGARVAAGGSVEDRLMAPTVLVDVPRDNPLVCEEAFGPVVSVIVVDSVSAAIDEVTAADYGLNTALYTGSLATSLDYARRAEAGTVLVNVAPSFRTDHMPYGGVKGSGQGREGVKYAVAELLQEKLVVLRP